MVPWTKTALAFSVYLLVVVAFLVNALLAFRKRRSFVAVLRLTVVLSWFVTVALLVLPPGRYEN